MIDYTKISETLRELETKSFEKYGGFGYVTGVYSVLLRELMTGYSTPDEIEHRINQILGDFRDENGN